MLQTIVINSILCSVSAYFVCYLFQMFRGIGHGDACSNCFQHFDVIVAIPKSDCLLRIQVVISQHSLDCSPFSAICRNNIDRPIPPCCYFGMGNVFHDQWILLFITSQHDLIDFFLQQIIKVICNLQCRPCNTQILCQIFICAICSHTIVCCDANRALDGRSIRNQFPNVAMRNRITEQYLTGIKAIGTVECQINIKFNFRKMRQLQWGSSSGKTKNHASCPQTFQSFNRFCGNLFSMKIDQCTVNVKKSNSYFSHHTPQRLFSIAPGSRS